MKNSNQPEGKVFMYNGDDLKLVDVKEIEKITSDNSYVDVKMTGSETPEILTDTLKHCETVLKPFGYICITRGCLIDGWDVVNLNLKTGKLLMADGKEYTVTPDRIYEVVVELINLRGGSLGRLPESVYKLYFNTMFPTFA